MMICDGDFTIYCERHYRYVIYVGDLPQNVAFDLVTSNALAICVFKCHDISYRTANDTPFLDGDKEPFRNIEKKEESMTISKYWEKGGNNCELH